MTILIREAILVDASVLGDLMEQLGFEQHKIKYLIK